MTCFAKKCVWNDMCKLPYDIGGCSHYREKRPQTNEEWLRSCTTEQLADVFFNYRYINATPQQQLWLSANEEYCKNGIVKWLKEIHHAN